MIASAANSTVASGVWLALAALVLVSGTRRIRAAEYATSRRNAHRVAVHAPIYIDGVAGELVDISVGVQVIIAAVLGGRRTVIGAAIGAIFLIGMGEILRPLGGLATLIVSVMALLVILFFPDGFLGMLRGRSRS